MKEQYVTGSGKRENGGWTIEKLSKHHLGFLNIIESTIEWLLLHPK